MHVGGSADARFSLASASEVRELIESVADPAEVGTFDLDTQPQCVELTGDDVTEVDRFEDTAQPLEFAEQFGVMTLLVAQQLASGSLAGEATEEHLGERVVVDAIRATAPRLGTLPR